MAKGRRAMDISRRSRAMGDAVYGAIRPRTERSRGGIFCFEDAANAKDFSLGLEMTREVVKMTMVPVSARPGWDDRKSGAVCFESSGEINE
uniref:Uncharacterized protein n=1 Tax=Candidatus Kentrum sp. LPFa TaxID=2126335 RepID=A0A450W675_9GAMM|nr:MAG: hypothetical protein BECKLPF1236B_GA0070989_103715 [Candidatus Kentron sp. LPFa]